MTRAPAYSYTYRVAAGVTKPHIETPGQSGHAHLVIVWLSVTKSCSNEWSVHSLQDAFASHASSAAQPSRPTQSRNMGGVLVWAISHNGKKGNRCWVRFCLSRGCWDGEFVAVLVVGTKQKGGDVNGWTLADLFLEWRLG